MWDEEKEFDSFNDEQNYEPSDDSLAEFSDFDQEPFEDDEDDEDENDFEDEEDDDDPYEDEDEKD
jgi:hypothetical protein